MRTFEIQLKLPSSKIATFSFFAEDENDEDLSYVFDALYVHARHNDYPEPKLIERIGRVIR